MKHPKPGVDYDQTSVESIQYYALQLEGSSLREQLEISPEENLERKGKGGFGESVEYYYFGYEPNSRNEPDFNEADLELKVTPLKVVRKNELVPKERLVITMINYPTVVHEKFETSTLYHKIKKMLLMHYLHDDKADPFDYLFKVIHVWEIPDKDYPTIKADWELVVNKVRAGLAHELSGSDTNYLEACTKGSDSTKTRKQPYSDIPAKPRAFALKSSYMKTIVNSALDAQEIKRSQGQEGLSLEQLVQEKIKPFIGKTDKELCNLLGVTYEPKNKSLWVKLTYKMLGITNNKSSEFMKANITVRSIRKEKGGDITESMSLTPFEFTDLANEEWEDSELFAYFDETRFLFVVFESDQGEYRLRGSAFWNMPARMLNNEVRQGWAAIRSVVESGVIFSSATNKSGKTTYSNNLPKKADNPVLHIRPHAKVSAYRFSDGTEVGNVERDASELPDGQWMTKQSFWLNNTFVSETIAKLGL